MKILVDVDNVLEDLNTAWVNAINEKYGTTTKPEDIRSWDIEKYFEGLSRTQVFSPLHKKEFWEKLEPMDGAREYLKRLIEDGNEIFIVTSCHPDTIKPKLKFLSKNFSFIPFKNIIITSHKKMIKGDVLIDDAPYNFLLEGDRPYGILMDAPHNRSFDEEPHAICRVSSWEDIYDYINLIKKAEEEYYKEKEARKNFLFESLKKIEKLWE